MSFCVQAPDDNRRRCALNQCIEREADESGGPGGQARSESHNDLHAIPAECEVLHTKRGVEAGMTRRRGMRR